MEEPACEEDQQYPHKTQQNTERHFACTLSAQPPAPLGVSQVFFALNAMMLYSSTEYHTWPHLLLLLWACTTAC